MRPVPLPVVGVVALVGSLFIFGARADSAGVTPAYVVNAVTDAGDANLADGLCRTSAGTCTLRAAVQQANVDAGPSAIHFAIPGTGVNTIQLTSNLPPLTDEAGPTTIDGYTQPGASPNTDPLADNAIIRVEARGTGPAGIDGLGVFSSGNTIRGLALYNFKRAVRLVGPTAIDNVVVGNFVGTNAAGTFNAGPLNSTSFGVLISEGASDNVIGRPTPADRNVVSGNAGRGIGVFSESNGNVIQNNLVGLDPTGFGRRSNLGHGVDINFNSQFTLIGGQTSMERIVVSGNGGEGIEISHGRDTAFNQVVGNYVGAAVDGLTATSSTRNAQANVRLEDRVSFNVVTDNLVVNNARAA